jgi:formylglycine-generating enzyme required for sulfatase activity
MRERVSRTIAVDGAYVSAFGAILFVLGGALPVWSVYHRTQTAAVHIEFVGGQLRPAMIMLPPIADGSTFAIAESEVTQSQFHHVTHGMARHIASFLAGSWHTCPVPFDRRTLNLPVTCISVREAIAYANDLTEIENRARSLKGEPPFTTCYAVATVMLANPHCTGYRLPTVEEWNYAAKNVGNLIDDKPERCAMAQLPDCYEAEGPRRGKELRPSPLFLYDIIGNAAELAISEASGGAAAVEALGGSWRDQITDQRKLFINPASDVGFRIVRTAQ